MPDDILKKQLFEKIYREHLYDIRFFAFHYLADMCLAEEAAHDVFMKFWNVMDGLDLESDIKPFLITLAKNRCLNMLKHQKIVEGYTAEQKKKILVNVHSLSQNTISKLYTNEVEFIIKKTLDGMSPKVRNAFCNSRFKGKTYEEIAMLEGVTVKAIEHRIMTALRLLRKSLIDYVYILVVYFF